MTRILVVDDDELPTPFVAALIEKRRASVQSTDSGEAGIELATGREFDPAIANLMIPGTEGLETISRIRPHKADIKIPAVSGARDSNGDHPRYARTPLGQAVRFSRVPRCDGRARHVSRSRLTCAELSL